MRIGGYISGGVLILFGIAVVALGLWDFSFTRDHIEREGITFGPATDPAVQEHAEQWAGEPVDTGRKALAMAEIMREHTLSSTGGLTYAQMGQCQRRNLHEQATKPVCLGRFLRRVRREPRPNIIGDAFEDDLHRLSG